MTDIQPGDVVVRVSGSNRFMRVGTTIRVADLCSHDQPWDAEYGTVGLLFDGYAGQAPGEFCDCFCPRNFRKLNDEPDNAELIERIRKCKPIKIGEPA